MTKVSNLAVTRDSATTYLTGTLSVGTTLAKQIVDGAYENTQFRNGDSSVYFAWVSDMIGAANALSYFQYLQLSHLRNTA